HALAVAILQRLREICPVSPEPITRSDHTLLAAASFPIALVEVGFLSNPKEAARLQEVSYRRALARAIAEGIADYLVRTTPQAPRERPGLPANRKTKNKSE
ncbi:MAG: hypothetical protein GX493_08550, partial [Firmicutes bacterium]|nr:hypothetical protein [Bacillota bacterium]